MPLIGRLVATLVAVVGVLATVFVTFRAVPGDPVDVLLGERATEQDRAALRRAMRLDGDLADQALAYAQDLGSMRLGESIALRGEPTPVATILAEALPPTIELALLSLLAALCLALPLGTLAALDRGGALDHAGRGLALVAMATPVFVTGPLAIWALAVELRWLPTPAHLDVGVGHTLLPAMIVGFALAGRLARLLRATMLDVLGSNLPLALAARGLGRMRILCLHVLPSALLPVLAVVAGQLGAMLGGALVTEKVFGRPGLGTLLLDAIAARDAPVVQGVVIVVALGYVGVHFAVDLIVAAVDPRTVQRADQVAP